MESGTPSRDTAWAMSQENVELVKRSVEAFNRGDIDAFLKDMADDAELDLSRARGPYRGVHRGREGVEVGGGGIGAVYTLCDGKIVRYQLFQSKADALEAAGLSD